MLSKTFLDAVEQASPGQSAMYAVILELPKPEQGDLAIPCFTLRKEGENPMQAATRVASMLSDTVPQFDYVVAGPYVNVRFPAHLLPALLQPPVPKKANGKVLVLDYSSPNIGKPFGIGHLRSTVIGACIKECYAYDGWKVEGINHIGDWGTQFGNLIVAYLRWGNNNPLDDDAVDTLYSLYVRFHKELEHDKSLEEEGRAWFAKLEQGDAEARRLWTLFREKSLHEFNKIYRLMGIEIEHTLGESFYEDKMGAVVEDLKSKNLLTLDEGAWIVDFAKHGITDIPPALIIKTNGTTTYVLRDIASLLYRKKTFHFDKALYEVGAEQNLHFKQVFAIAKLLGHSLDAEHISHGLYVFPEGKMSTRKGNIIFIEDVIAEAIKKAEAVIAEKNPSLPNKHQVASQVALAAIIFQDLRQDRIKTVTFSWEKMLDFEGETGPYIQYTYARIASILRKAPTTPPKQITALRNTEEEQLAKHVLRFDETIEQVVKQAKPHLLCRYVLDLTQLFNTFYVQHKVIQQDEDIMHDRLALLWLTRQTIKQAMNLLHIQLPEEM